MDKHHIEQGNVAQQMLTPELVITVTGRAGVGNDRRGDEGENRAGKSPEIADIKQTLRFADEHIATENDAPATDCNRKMINGICV